MSRLGSIATTLGWTLLIAFACTVGRAVARAEEASGERPEPLRFRKVLVPGEEIKHLTQRYMPMKRDEFAQLLQRVRSHARSVGMTAARVQSAWYYAVIEDQQLVHGQASLQVVHNTTETSTLSLNPCRLPMGPAFWHGKTSSEPATVGTDAAGNLMALVAHSGTLQFSWTLRGKADELGAVGFDLQLAVAPRNQLILDSPDDSVVDVEQGLLSLWTETEPQDLPRDIPPLTSGHRRWIIRLGGAAHVRVRVTSQDAVSRRGQLVELRQRATYRLAEDGLEVQCDMRLDVRQDLLHYLTLDIPTELEVTAARLGDADVPWTIAATHGKPRRQLQFHFEQPLGSGTHQLHVVAVAPLRTDTSWKLPVVAARGVFWRQGSLDLRIPDAIELCQLEARGAHATGTRQLLDQPGGESRDFQLFEPQGTLEILVRRRKPEVVVAMGTTIDVDPNTLTARSIIDLRCQFGRKFVLEAEVPSEWTIDGIEAEPADVIDNYQFVAHTAGTKRLQIQLAKALAPDRPIRLTVRAHRSHGFVLRTDSFRALQLVNVSRTARQVAITPDPTYRFNLSGDAELVRLDVRNLAPADANRLDPRSGALVFVDDEQADLLTIRMAREDPVYAASIRVEVELREDMLTELYRIVCRPESVGVHRLLVHLSVPRASAIRWTIQDKGDNILPARQLDAPEQQRARLNRSGETWEITLPGAHDQPFEIRGRRETRFEGATAISLATLPAAASQEGWATIRCLDGGDLAIEPRLVRAIPSRPVAPDQYTTARARYRYDPSRNAQIIIDRATKSEGQATLWVWNATLISRFDQVGRIVDRMIYRVENLGSSSFRVQLPSGCTMLGVEIDGVAIAGPLRVDDKRNYTIPLPARRRFPRVEIVFQRRGPALGIFDRVEAAFPKVQVPVIDRRWTAWLPPGFQAVTRGTHVWPSSAPGYGWRQRLLGPLAAAPDGRPFRLFSSTDWLTLVGVNEPHVSQVATAQNLLKVVGQHSLDLEAESGESAAVTWRTLLAECQGDIERLEQRLSMTIWIDEMILTDDGFRLDQSLPAIRGGTPEQVATAVLAQANLVLLVSDHALLLTSTNGLSRYYHSLEPMDQRALAIVRNDSELADRLKTPNRHARTGLLPLRAWLAQPPVPRSPWQTGSGMTERGLMSRPWQICEVPIGVDGSCRLTVYQPAMFGAMGWAALLFAAGLFGILVNRAPRSVVPCITVCAVAAMLVPEMLVPVSSNVLLGAILGSILRVVVRKVPVRRVTRESSSTQTAVLISTGATAGILLIAMILIGIREADAQERAPVSAATPEPAEKHPVVHRLLVPVNDQREPIGEYDYLPLPFYDEIHRRSKQGSISRQGWLLRSAMYRAVFNWRRQRTALDLTGMTAVYQLEVFQPRQRVQLPWPGDSNAVEILEARLAGEPVELIWNDAHTAFLVPVEAEGVSQLELVLRPGIRADGRFRTLQFPVPTVARARLQIESPADAQAIEVFSAMGISHAEVESGTLNCELGPADTIAIRWSSGSEASQGIPLEVEQLMWLRVQSREEATPVILDTKWTFHALGEAIQQVTLDVDPALRLLPLDESQHRLVNDPIVKGETKRTISFKLREPVEGDFSLRLRFALAGIARLGDIALPRLNVEAAAVSRRWLAVSVATDLEANASRTESVSPLDASEFLGAWGEADASPKLTYRLLAANPSWSLATRARSSRTEAGQHVDFRVGRTAIDWVLQAQLDTSEGEVFQHRLQVPSDATLQSVVVTVEDANVAAYAHKDETGVVTVFLARGVSGQYQLELRGRKRLTANPTRMSMPRVSLLGVNVVSSEIYVYRQPEVLVDVKHPDDMARRDTEQVGRFRESFGRLVAALDLVSDELADAREILLHIRPNQPHANVRLVTTLKRNAEQWEAGTLVQVQLTPEPAGVLDKVRCEVPSEWSGPYVLEPAVPYRLESIPGRRRKYLILRPDQPITSHFEVHIRGALKLSDNERVRTPDIIPLNVANVDRYFVLPTQLDQQRIDWKTSGLQPIPLRDVLGIGVADPRFQAAYRVWSKYRVWSQPRAVIADVQRVEGEKRISLADLRIACRKDGRCAGVATFQLEPAGASSCTLTVPAAYELIRVTVDDVPATLIPLADRRWHVRLGPDQLPQQVKVVFQGRLDQPLTVAAQPLAVPWISDFDVERTLWTIRGMSGELARVEGVDEHRVGALRQWTMRLANTANLIASASEIALDRPPEEIADWYAPWAVRLVTDIAHVARNQWSLAKPVRWDSADLQAIESQQNVIADQLKTDTILRKARQRTSDSPQPGDIWNVGRHPGSSNVGYAFIAAAPSIPVVSPHSLTRASWSRWASTLVVALLGGLLVWSSRRGQLAQWLAQWPFVLGVLIGLTWWLFCSPSILGWLIVGLSLLGALRTPAPCHRLRDARPNGSVRIVNEGHRTR